MPENPFKTNFLLVTFPSSDDFTEGYAVIQNPRLVSISGVPFLEGTHSTDRTEYVSGRRILFPLASVTSITEYESLEQIWERASSSIDDQR